MIPPASLTTEGKLIGEYLLRFYEALGKKALRSGEKLQSLERFCTCHEPASCSMHEMGTSALADMSQ